MRLINFCAKKSQYFFLAQGLISPKKKIRDWVECFFSWRPRCPFEIIIKSTVEYSLYI
ncbi:uncharacterized protein DS421_14g455490 [Arachis hypogaea]|nr:uncharacterized protein DS421_14g455490 [Arachis hypogaea]